MIMLVPTKGDMLMPSSHNSWRDWLFGRPLRPVMLCGELDEGPLEAVYHYTEGRLGERCRDGRLPWAILDAWHVCEASLPGNYKHLPYEVRNRWVRKASAILLSHKDELDGTLATPPAGEAAT